MDPSAGIAIYYVISLVVFIVISIGIFLICRELICWYWKINESLRVQKEIASKLDEIIGLLNDPHGGSRS